MAIPFLSGIKISTAFSSAPSDSIFLYTGGSNTPGGGSEIIFGTSTSASTINYNAKIAGVRSALDNGSSDLQFLTTHVATATAPSTKMTIKSDGKIGIGTVSPESKLTIKGDPGNTNQPTKITNNSTDTHTGLFLNGTGNAVNEKYGLQFGNYNEYSIGGIFGVMDSVSASTSGDITIDFGNGTSAGALIERVRFTHEGRVGIGTNAPSQKLTIREDSNTTYSTDDAGTNTGDFVLQNNNQTDDNFNRISFQSTSDNNQTGDLLDAARITAIYPDHAGGNPSGELAFETKADAGSMAEAMRIDRDGKIGMGTNSPYARLHLSGDNSNKSSLRQSRTGVVVWDQAIDSSGRLQWGTRATEGGTRTVRFTLDDNGYIGIGPHAPTAALHVKGTTNIASRFIFTKDLETDKILFGGADHDDFDTFVGSSSNHSFTITQNGGAAITIDTSKNATFEGNVVSKDTFYLENSDGKRWQQLFDGNNWNIRYYNGSNWSADALAIDTSNNASFAGSLSVSDIPFNSTSVSVLVADEILGSDLITNGDFSASTGWSIGSGWTISNGKASVDTASTVGLTQSISVVSGNVYKVSLEVSDYTSGTLQPQFGGSQVISQISANGKYVYTVTSSVTNTTFYLYAVGDAEFTVDNLSVKQITSASDQIKKREISSDIFTGGPFLPLAGGTMTGSLTIPDYIIHDGDPDTQFGFSGANTFIVKTGGSNRFSISGDVGVVGTTDFFIPQGRKLLLDGAGGHTYIEEESDSNLKFYVAGGERLNITNTQAIFADKITSNKNSESVSTTSFNANHAHLDLFNSWQSNTDQKGSIITFTDNYYDGSNYYKTLRGAIKGGTDQVGNTGKGYLEFYTNANSANSPQLALRLDADKNATFSGSAIIRKSALGGSTVMSDGTLIFGAGSTDYFSWRLDSNADLYLDKVYGGVNANVFSIDRSTTNGDITFAGTVTAPKGRFTSTGDASVTSTTHAFQAGTTSGANVIIDNNEIMARNNGATSPLNLNPDGNTVTFHSNGNSSQITDSGNATFAGSVTAGSAHFTGNVEVGDGTDTSMSSTSAGQLKIDGNGYDGAIALNDTAMYIYHNSSLRDLVLGTNETARLTIAGNSGNTTITGTITATNFSGSSSGTNTGDQDLSGYSTTSHNHDGRYLRTHSRLQDDFTTITTSGVHVWDVSEASDEPPGASDGLLTIKFWDSSCCATAQFHDFHQNNLWITKRSGDTWQTDWAQVYSDEELGYRDLSSVTSATTTTTVASVSGTTYAAVFFDYVIYKSSNIRAGTVVACSDGTNVSFTETSTEDLGDTSDVTLTVDYSSSNMRLRATTTSSTWNIKAIIRAI